MSSRVQSGSQWANSKSSFWINQHSVVLVISWKLILENSANHSVLVAVCYLSYFYNSIVGSMLAWTGETEMAILTASGQGITSLRSHTAWPNFAQRLPADALILWDTSGGDSAPP